MAAGDVQVRIDGLDELLTLARTMSELLGRMAATMATQDDVDAIASRLSGLGSTLGAALSGISDDLAALKAQADAGQQVDLSGVQAAVIALGNQVQAATDLDAEYPPPST